MKRLLTMTISLLLIMPTAYASEVVAAGDLCPAGSPGHCAETSQTALSLGPDAVLTLGDNQYDTGTLAEFMGSYDKAWGGLKSITYPQPGNHEWESGLVGYRAYFNDPRFYTDGNSWYSYDLGDWHIVSLDSECAKIGGCNVGAPENTWLANDLANDTHACTLAYFHRPLFASTKTGSGTSKVRPLWKLLVADGTELLLNGHRHNYERFAAQDELGNATPNGMVEFIIGTGGKSMNPFGIIAPNSVARVRAYGVGDFMLNSGAWSMEFIDTSGTTLDSAAGTCLA